MAFSININKINKIAYSQEDHGIDPWSSCVPIVIGMVLYLFFYLNKTGMEITYIIVGEGISSL
ncbi:MAG: hypothetical protein ACO1G6_01680 [Bacteroidota bacterium]